jgi:hypothetical protein
MKLITKEIEKKLPPLGSTGSKKPENVPIIVKFFNPVGSGTFYITEFDGIDTLFGYTTGLGFDELGYISLKELQSIRGKFGLGIERDRNYSNHTLAEVMSKN